MREETHLFVVFGSLKRSPANVHAGCKLSCATRLISLVMANPLQCVLKLTTSMYIVLSTIPTCFLQGGEYPKRSRSSKETVEKLEKRLLEALARTINSSDSFFFTYDGDLTNTIQRRKLSTDRQDIPQWAKVN